MNFNGASAFRADEGRSVSVGDDCLFAENVRVWTSDLHSIVEAQTRNRVNLARNTKIGNRVWLGDGALVLKGSTIGDGSIIGAGAVLAGDVPENSVAAGNRATVVKRGVTWDKELLPPPLMRTAKKRSWF